MIPAFVQAAYHAGRAAAGDGVPAGANPHDDWSLGVAWAAGWHFKADVPWPDEIVWQWNLLTLDRAP